MIEFPIRICDLTPNTHVAITVYDLSRLSEEGPLASTVLDIFDSKQRLRQGTMDLLLWKNTKPDMSFECLTPGLVSSHDDSASLKNFHEINKLLSRVDMYAKKPRPDDNKEWIDRHSWEAIY